MKTQVVINAKIYTGQEVVENGFIRYAETIKRNWFDGSICITRKMKLF